MELILFFHKNIFTIEVEMRSKTFFLFQTGYFCYANLISEKFPDPTVLSVLLAIRYHIMKANYSCTIFFNISVLTTLA